MKKSIIITLLILLVAYFVIVQRITVNAGMEAVVIKKPWFLQKAGIEKAAISTGTIWAVSSSTIKLFSLKPFEISESFSGFLTEENIPIDFTVNMSFQYQKGNTPLLVEKFGDNNEWYSTLLLSMLKVSLEAAVKSHPLQELQANSSTVQTIEESTEEHIKNFLTIQKIPVTLIQLHINTITPPKKLIDAAIETVKVKEKIKTKEEQIKVEALRRELEESRANADKAYMLKMKMSVGQYIQMKQLELEEKKLLNQRYIIEQAKDSNGTIELTMDMGK